MGKDCGIVKMTLLIEKYYIINIIVIIESGCHNGFHRKGAQK